MRGGIIARFGVLALLSSLLTFSAGCTNDKSLTGQTASTGRFIQVARIGRPLVIELFTPWADHDFILRSAPGSDAGKLYDDIGTFMSATAGRSAAITLFVQNMLAGQADMPPSTFPTEGNALVVDLSVQGSATFLGVESGGRITASGGINPHPTLSFGGRGLTDDVAAIELGLAFGSLVPQIDTKIPDDGNEKDGRDGRPNLANDNVTSLTPPPKHYQIGYPYSALQFPYLGQSL